MTMTRAQFHTLDEYVERMSENQDDIYYVVADDYRQAARAVPHLDAFRQRGIEVLYFTHPVDAMLPMGLVDFKGHKLVSVDSAELDLAEVGEAAEVGSGGERGARKRIPFVALTERVKATLGGRVSDVRESKTLVGSPARLVSEDDSSEPLHVPHQSLAGPGLRTAGQGAGVESAASADAQSERA